MDTKITKKRLNELLSYDWIKIIALIVAGIVIWSLIFTVSAVRVSVGQDFKVFFYYDVARGENYESVAEDVKSSLSYDILSYNEETLMESAYATVLSARFSVQEGDLMFITNIDKDVNDAAIDSNFKSFVDSYNNSYSIEQLIEDAENYYKNFYVIEDGEFKFNQNGTPVFNMIFLKSKFNERMKGDNRYHTDSEREKGYIDEMNRIDALRKGVERFKEIIAENPDLLVKYKRNEQYLKNNPDTTEIEVGEEKSYGINLSLLPNISQIIKNIDGSTDGLTLVALNWKDAQPDLQYEVIPAIVKILDFNKVDD